MADELQRYHLPDGTPLAERVAVHDLHTYLQVPRDAPFQPHLHSFHQIIWFERGTGDHLVDFDRHALLDRTLVFVPSGAIHAFDRGTRSAFEGSAGRIVHFEDGVTQETGMVGAPGLDFSTLLRGFVASGGPLRTLERDPVQAVQAAIESLAAEVNREPALGRLSGIEAALRLLLIHVSRAFESREAGAPNARTSAAQQRLLGFIHLVDGSFAAGESIEWYARELGVSSKTLSRVVRDAMGSSPREVITRRVVLEMQRLLVHSRLSVKEISHRVGIRDASYGTRVFRRITGVPPAEFRERWKEPSS